MGDELVTVAAHGAGGAGAVELPGRLSVPDTAFGLVVFAHGSGSSHRSPRNLMVAGALRAAGLATLLFDLLTEHEGADVENRFDIGLLAERLEAATAWARRQAAVASLPLGYFGASTGAAAALVAAAEAPEGLRAVVSRGGRPDLAGDALPEVLAPTLLVVGGEDRQVLELNRLAQSEMKCETELVVVPGATHLFDEPGTLEAAATAAATWFSTHLRPK